MVARGMLLIAALLLPGTGLTQSLYYVADLLVLTVREAPGESARRLENIATGDEVLVLEEDPQGYVRVQLESGTEGWVHKQYLTPILPARSRLQDATGEIERIARERDELVRDNLTLTQEKDALEAQLAAAVSAQAQLRSEFEQLREATVLGPQAQQAFESRIARLDEEVRLLRQHGRELEDTSTKLWFVAGGTLAVAAMVVGLLAGRAAGRRRSGWG